MSLKVTIESLEEVSRIKLAVAFLEIGTIIWDNFAETNSLEYTDSVVGVHHKIDGKLIQRTINAAKSRLQSSNYSLRHIFVTSPIKKLHEEFLEPITALQDSDWEIPEEPLLIFYSAYNLLEKLNGKDKNHTDELITYTSINQSIDAIIKKEIMSIDDIKKLLKNTDWILSH